MACDDEIIGIGIAIEVLPVEQFTAESQDVIGFPVLSNELL